MKIDIIIIIIIIIIILIMIMIIITIIILYFWIALFPFSSIALYNNYRPKLTITNFTVMVEAKNGTNLHISQLL